jgi:hypothetical protein
MKKRETPQALMALWLQAGPTPCRWRLMQARLSNQSAPTLGSADRHSRNCKWPGTPEAVSAR